MMVKHKEVSRPVWRMLPFLGLLLLALFLIIKTIHFSIPDIQAGYAHWPEYLNLEWAHQESLIQVLINFTLMVWLSYSGLFFGGWLLHRSIRKLRGKRWSIVVGQDKKRFFPPVLRYLKFSCYFLVLIFLFVIIQYPLQFIYYSG